MEELFILTINRLSAIREWWHPDNELKTDRAKKHWKRHHKIEFSDFDLIYNTTAGFIFPQYGRGVVVCRHPSCKIEWADPFSGKRLYREQKI